MFLFCCLSLTLLDVSNHFPLFFLRGVFTKFEVNLSCENIVIDVEIFLPLSKFSVCRALLKSDHVIYWLFFRLHFEHMTQSSDFSGCFWGLLLPTVLQLFFLSLISLEISLLEHLVFTFLTQIYVILKHL